MSTIEDRELVAECAINNAIRTTLFGRLGELVIGCGKDVSVNSGTIGKTLEIIQDIYFLVPKVSIDASEKLVVVPTPENAIKISLLEYWTNVSN